MHPRDPNYDTLYNPATIDSVCLLFIPLISLARIYHAFILKQTNKQVLDLSFLIKMLVFHVQKFSLHSCFIFYFCEVYFQVIIF